MSVEEGRAAVRAANAVAARAAVADLDQEGDVLEILARADHLDLKLNDSIAMWERAYAAYRASDDRLGAIRAARTLAGLYYSVAGDMAVSRGWTARANTLLEGVASTSERGWVSLNAGMVEADRARKNERFRAALKDARAVNDLALEIAALAYLGASLVHADEIDDGMQMLDEALAALAGSEVDDFSVLEEVFCQLLSACERAHDVGRAEQWMRVGDTIATRRQLPSVSAHCQTHYGGVLTAAGRWDEADATLTRALQLWELGRRSVLRGGALARLADLRVRQGRYEEAELLLQDLEPLAEPEATRTRAAILFAKGNIALARDALERAIADCDVSDSALYLELLAEVLLADGDVAGAEGAADQLAAGIARHDTDYMRAISALTRGRVCMAQGAGDPQSCLREALQRFTRAQMPLELAHTHLELARALVETRPEVAIAEAQAALEGFQRLKAARLADAAAALLRTLGVRPATARGSDHAVLTKREAEVLDLIGEGLSNPEIASRLFISRKTVEHHVGNVLAKLGLRSRAEAAVYAVRESARE